MTNRPSTEFTDTEVADLRFRISDLDARIQRQEKRIQEIKVTGAGPCVEMEALLMDMLERRDAMQWQLADIEAAPAQVRPVERGAPKLRLVASNGRAINQAWHIELFLGGVRLKKAGPNPS